jgi:DnaK suppressor protein
MASQKRSLKSFATVGGRVKALSENFIIECKMKLIEAKREILNRVRASRAEFQTLDRSGGDEADQTMHLLAENDFLSAQSRLKQHLLEIEMALARIQTGRFGICEETDEPIEYERLRALPWTRLSIEGAEIRESAQTRYAR